MEQNLHFVTLSTPDLDATRAFYSELGWQTLADVEGEIIFYQVAPGLILGFFETEKYKLDLQVGSGRFQPAGVTLSHNVDSPDSVRTLVSSMVEAGGTMLKPPQDGQFGGVFHAHVCDPNGVTWEIAHNPRWRIDQDGTVKFESSD